MEGDNEKSHIRAGIRELSGAYVLKALAYHAKQLNFIPISMGDMKRF
jgi:hypothetical protein